MSRILAHASARGTAHFFPTCRCAGPKIFRRTVSGLCIWLPGLLVPLFTPPAATAQQPAVIASGTPLYIRVTQETSLRIGAPVQGVLTQSVWVSLRKVLPSGTVVTGTVTALGPAPRLVRLKALLNGDLTPLHSPVVDFSTAIVDKQALPLHSVARVQQVKMVRFVAQPHRSLFGKLIQTARDKLHQEHDMVLGPNKRERAVHLLYSQLPYHPQRIWTNTEFVAELSDRVSVALPRAAPPPVVPARELTADLPAAAVVRARLVTALNCDTSTRGEPVTALLTAPLFDSRHRILLSQGARLEGRVRQVKRSRSFGRNGALRFSFDKVQPVGRPKTMQLFGTLSGAAGSSSQNVRVGAEGTVQAQPDSNRFLAPFVLAALASRGQDGDGAAGAEVLASNGLGIVAPIASLASGSRNVATGFGAYALAKSIYFRFVARGHAVTFPADTPLEVQLSSR